MAFKKASWRFGCCSRLWFPAQVDQIITRIITSRSDLWRDSIFISLRYVSSIQKHQRYCLYSKRIFVFSGFIIKKLGHVCTMTMILLVMGIRLLCYSFLINPWFTLLIDLLHGITLGTFLSAVYKIKRLLINYFEL